MCDLDKAVQHQGGCGSNTKPFHAPEKPNTGPAMAWGKGANRRHQFGTTKERLAQALLLLHPTPNRWVPIRRGPLCYMHNFVIICGE